MKAESSFTCILIGGDETVCGFLIIGLFLVV